MATGRRANVNGLDLKAARVHYEDRGIKSTNGTDDQQTGYASRRGLGRTAVQPTSRIICRPGDPERAVSAAGERCGGGDPVGNLHGSRARPVGLPEEAARERTARSAFCVAVPRE